LLRSILHSESNSFVKYEYHAYFDCCFVKFIYEIEVVFMHLVHVMELGNVFPVEEMKECEIVLVWIKQYFLALALGE
jgi:hypothetical protein